jgi:Methane oxygenase PmoA
MRYDQVSNQESRLYLANGELVAGINIGTYRPWIYPLIAPSGINILREFPPDHGFHNGAFFGHNPVRQDAVNHNFWGAPPFRSDNDPLGLNLGYQKVLANDVRIENASAIITLNIIWIGNNNITLIDETRTITVCYVEGAYKISISSLLKNRLNSSLILGKTKFSGHAFRLDVSALRLKAALYKINNVVHTIDALHEKIMRKDTFSIATDTATLEFSSPDNSVFFVRPYGFVSCNPFLHSDQILPEKASITFTTNLKLT